MTCYRPLTGFYSKERSESGKRKIVFNINDSLTDRGSIRIPCGQCVGCRLEYSRQWAIRCVHEAAQFEKNCFITLTYDDKNLPKDGSLNKRHYQLFMKRLRKLYEGHDYVFAVDPKTLEEKLIFPIRFYHCGEYGEKYGRPHYHACLFNFDFEDKVLFKNGQNKLYTSKSLSELWPHGFATIGDVTFDSAAYVARYIMKKIKGKDADAAYTRKKYDAEGNVTEEYKIQPEYTTMSRKPGIGKFWYDVYSDEVYPDDFVVIRGKEVRPPKYYDGMYEIDNPECYSNVRAERKFLQRNNIDNSTDRQLDVKEKVKTSKINAYLKRTVE